MENQISPRYKSKDWFFLLLIALIWGSADILAKKGLKVFSPNEVGVIRIFITSIFFTPFAITTVGKIKFDKLSKLLLIGILGSVIPVFLMARSQCKLDSWINSALNSLGPIMTLLLARFLFNKPVSLNEVIGIMVGFIGAIILISGVIGTIHGDTKYIIFPILSALCRSLSANLLSKYIIKTKIFTATAISLIPYSLIMGFILFIQTDILQKIHNIEGSVKALGFVITLTLTSSIVANIIFNMLTRNTSPIFASISCLIAPIISIVWGILDGEKLVLTHYIGIITILSGVYLLNRRKKLKH